MSDREWSLPRNGSWAHGHAGKEGKGSRGRSRSMSRSRSRSRSPAKQHRKYSSSEVFKNSKPTFEMPSRESINREENKSRTPSPTHSYKGYRGGDKRNRYRSRSRSQSGGRRGGKRSRYSRSRSLSYGSAGYRARSHSHSPMSSRRRHVGDRVGTDNPTQSRCLGVFGLSLCTTEQQITQIFSKYGPVEKVQVVIDAKTGRSRGFCFVYFEDSGDAKIAKDQCTGMEIGGRKIRVDYSITQRAHTPTPGIYMGVPTVLRDNGGYRDERRRGDRDNYYGGRGGGGYGGRDYRSRRSPSPYYRGRGGHRSRYDRSRSRSYSPRRY